VAIASPYTTKRYIKGVVTKLYKSKSPVPF
jgi:hypothetical protein